MRAPQAPRLRRILMKNDYVDVNRPIAVRDQKSPLGKAKAFQFLFQKASRL